MKFKFVILSLGIMLCFSAIAQPITFKRTYGTGFGFNTGYGLVQLPDSGFIITGSSSGFSGGATDILLIRTDKNGIQQWIKSISYPGVDVARKVKPTADGNYIICGYTNSKGNGGYDVFVAKIDENGDTLFTKTYGGADWDFGYSIEPTSDGGYVIAGETYNNSRGYNDFYILKIDADGNQLWEKNYGSDTVDVAYNAVEAYNGDILVVGSSNGYSSNKLGDGLVIRISATGDSLKKVLYGTTADESVYGIALAPDSGYFVCGTSRPTNTEVNNFMHFKANKDDEIVNTYIINNGFSTTLRSIIALNSTDVLVAGYSHPPGDNTLFGLVQKFNVGDWYQWGCDLNIPNKEEDFMDVIPTSDGGYCAVGTVKDVSPGLTSASLLKIGGNGEQSSGVVLSAKDEPAYHFAMYPNPTFGNINLQFEKPVKQLSLAVYNGLGEQVFAKQYNNVTAVTEDLNQLDSGLYLIQLVADRAVGSQRLVIAK